MRMDSKICLFINKPTLNSLELKEDKCTEYFIGWKQKWVYATKLFPLYTAFLHNMSFQDIKEEYNSTEPF